MAVFSNMILGGDSDDEGVGSLFNILGGGGRPKQSRRAKMKPMQYALEVTLDEVFTGVVKKMKLNRVRNCKSCKGYFWKIMGLGQELNQERNREYARNVKGRSMLKS